MRRGNKRKRPTSASGEHGEEFFLQRKTQVADGQRSTGDLAAGTLLHGRFGFQTLNFVHGGLSLLAFKQHSNISIRTQSIIIN